MENTPLSAAQRVSLLIEKLDISAYQFARETGLSHQTISNVLTGKSKPSLDTLEAIARRYPNTATWLLTGLGELMQENKQLAPLPKDPAPPQPTAGPLQVVAESEELKDLKRRNKWLEEQVELWQRIALSGTDLSKLALTGTDGESFAKGNHQAAEQTEAKVFMEVSYRATPSELDKVA